MAVMAFYLPTFNSTKVANAALIGTTVLTTVWFILGNPFGINDTYIALITPMIVMVSEICLNVLLHVKLFN